MANLFTTKLALEMVLEELNNGYEGEVSDLHRDVFHSDYYIVGTHAATKALEEYGVFKAIKLVQEYHLAHFGEVFTDFTSPESLATDLMSVIAGEAYFELESVNNNYDNSFLDEDVKEQVTEEIEKLLALM